MPISLDGQLGINSSGNITVGAGSYYLGDGGLLSNVSTSGNSTGVVSGNSSILFDGNGNAVINIGGSNVAVLTPDGLEITGNINPSANVIYTLGNSTNQWKDLWVSNNTIYINSVPLTIGDGSNVGYGANTLFVNANPVVTAGPNVVNSGNVVTTGNIAAGNGAGNTTTVANVGIIFPDGTVQTTAGGGGPGNYGNANVTLLLSDGSVTTDIITTANVQGSNVVATYLWGDGSNITGLPASYTDSNVTALLSSGNVATDIITTANVNANNVNSNSVTSTNITATANVAAGNVNVGNIYATGFNYANGTPVSFDQPVFVTSNIANVNVLGPILVNASYGNASYPGGIFTLYQPAGAVVTGSLAWASGGTSKNQYTNYAGNVVNTQNISLTLNCANGTFNIQSSDTITIGGSTITGSNITGLGISGTGGTYTIPSTLFANSIQTAASTTGNVTLTTSSGPESASVGTLTTVAPVPFAVSSLTAAWANANVILGNATQTFTWTASGVTGSITAGNVTLAGSSNLVLSNTTATTGTSPAITSDTGPYNLNAQYTGTGLNGAGSTTVNVPYTLAPAVDIAPLFYKTTSSNANPNFTTADSHYNVPLYIPNAPQGTPMPANAQGILTNGVTNDYQWLAIPGGAGTWNWSDSVPASGNVNIYAMYDNGTFYQIYTGTPTPTNFGQQYFTTLNGTPYTVVGWNQFSAPVFLYLAKIV